MEFEISRSISLGLIIVIFVVAYIYARARGPVEHKPDSMEEEATDLLTDDRQV